MKIMPLSIVQMAFGLCIMEIGLVGSMSTHRERCDVQVKPGPGTPIQSAIDTAAEGSTICIGPGTYPEQVTITRNGISLVGHGSTLVPPASFGSNLCSSLVAGASAGVCIAGSGVVFGACPYPEHCKVVSVNEPVKNVAIRGLEIHGFGENIAIIGADSTEISDNTLVDGSYYGVVAVGSMNTRTTRNKLQTTKDLFFIAICTDDFSGVCTTSNQISGYDVGLCIQTSHSVQEDNNVSGCCTGAFVDPNVVEAQVRNNYFGPTDPRCTTTWPFNGGIYLTGAIKATIEGNTVVGQRSNGQAPGIAVVDGDGGPGSSNNIIRRNTLANNDVDIYLNTTGSANLIQDNQCRTSFPAGFC